MTDCCTVFVLQIKPFIHYYTTTVYDDGGKEALLGVICQSRSHQTGELCFNIFGVLFGCFMFRMSGGTLQRVGNSVL